MFKNYLKATLRNLLRYKGFATINIASLTIGIIACLTIGLFVWDEMQYDKNIPDGHSIYRIYNERRDNNSITHAACVPPAYTKFLQQQYPEVDNTARILMSRDKFLVEAGDKKAYEEKGLFVDGSFLDVFSLKLIKGNPATALTAPNTIVISEALARKYFGNENPIDKTLRIDKGDVAVKGVFASLPDHFHLNFNYLISLQTAGLPKERMDAWTWNQFYTYIKLKPGSNVAQLEQKFQAHVKKEIHPTLRQEGSTFLPFFQQLKDIHLKSSDFIYDNAIRGNETSVKALTIIALFVLAIACFNFINLATARSFRRAKEIGVRKVVGAERKQLILQFISETVLLSVFSTIIAAIVTSLLIPALNRFSGKSIEFNPFTNPTLCLLLLGGAVVIGILAGLYPALVLSGFQPIKVLKNINAAGSSSGKPWLRQALVVVQFSLSALLIVSTMIVYKQTNYLNNKDLGFNKEQIVYFQIRDSVETALETFKSELRRSPNIVSVTSGYGLPGDQFAGDGVIIPRSGQNIEHSANVFFGDHDYVKTLGLKIVAGRDFSKDMSTDVEEAFLINETAVRDFGFGSAEKAIGQKLHWNKWNVDSLNPVKKGKVIGVVQDFHYKSLHEKVTASVIQMDPGVNFKIAAKLKTADISNTIAFINNVWNSFSPGYPLDYQFMDETYGKMYKSEQKLATLLWIFTIMAIIVGCMGLFALAAFSAEQRTKEIGIRKVLGASVINIVTLLSKTFLTLVLIASVIAFPIAWWAMNNWLEDFPYRVNISWWIFGIAAVAALGIALLTVSFQAIKAAIVSPVKSLRSE